jgi:hypothetical protein
MVLLAAAARSVPDIFADLDFAVAHEPIPKLNTSMTGINKNLDFIDYLLRILLYAIDCWQTQFFVLAAFALACI